MAKTKQAAPTTPLDKLIQAADATVLGQLVRQLAGSRAEVRRECLEFLQQHVTATTETKADAEAEAAFALWEELEPDLAELNEYGGGPDETEEQVADLLDQLAKKLEQAPIPRDARWELLNQVMPYIRSNNAGMEDGLYDVAYGTCKDDEDWREFAILLETAGRDYLVDHARRIYRKLGDRDKYLALRSRRMEYGADYHDLATFYWEQGEPERALAIAREGMQHAKGRMDELRAFLAKRAEESGDRQGYLELQFAQATSGLTLTSYKAFQELCTAEEWAAYEPRLLTVLEQVRGEERLKILMERGEYDRAITILSGMRYPDHRYDGGTLLEIAAQLEDKYPDKVLAFYLSGLGNLKQSASRELYARKAKVVKKVRHMWLDILKAPAKWEAFARQLKSTNQRRFAFHEELAKVVPGWRQL